MITNPISHLNNGANINDFLHATYETAIDAEDTKPMRVSTDRALKRIQMAQTEARAECPACGNCCEAMVLVCPVCFTPSTIRPKAVSVNGIIEFERIRLTEDAFIDSKQPLMLEFGVERIILPPEDTLVIGRCSPVPGEASPRVDVKIVQGKEFGISRQHARLTRLGGLVYITDLGSINGTFLNGQQLPPHFSRLIHDGDELQLGHLRAHLHFCK